MKIIEKVVRIWSIFMQLFPLMIITLASSSLRGNEVERLSLLHFKSVVNDTRGLLSSWNESSNLCKWSGVTCGRRHQRVVVLDLQSSQLKGILSSHIGNLSFLRSLSLSNNSFVGTIPQEIGRLSRLQELNLRANFFTGDIPINISHCSNLQYLQLARNHLSGKIPMQLGSLLKLQNLTLSMNNLSGEIPMELGSLLKLQKLSLSMNNLAGEIPPSFGNFSSLWFLAVGDNRLTGTIPPSIYNISSIEVISVIENQLDGTLPFGLGDTIFPNLQIFQFQMNRFSGAIPFTISNASHLSSFGISTNNFTGKVPSFARVSSLFRLEMGDNNLRNEDGDLEFLSSLVNCTSLQLLDISGNKFEGVLPDSLSNLSTKLEIMNLGRNRLRGSIPFGIGNLSNLEVLSFEENVLKGTIPNSVCQMTNLYNLVLSYNQLSGTIPSCLENLTFLSRLDLKSNNLQGGIPESLGDSMNLLALDLSQNNLIGLIPQEVFRLPSLSLVLDLSSNQFSGNIPIEVGLLPNLAFLNLAENRLSGEILQGLVGCTSLVRLNLSRNMFQGKISQSLSPLRGLEDLDLSRNFFIGAIPDYLQSFPFLQNLNLSFNDFRGEVPVQGVFRNASAVSLMGNRRICGGAPQLRLPTCITPNPPRNLPKPANALIYKLAVILISSGVIGVIWLFYFVLLNRVMVPGVKSSSEPSLDVSYLKLSYADLLKATDSFSSRNLIGSGSSGSVYWGVLDQEEERIVAVKVLNLQSSRASRSFISECEVLKNIRHRNLVRLVTACSSIDFQGNEFKALVFEFMLDGNLDEWLHYPAQRVDGSPIVQLHLNLLQRLSIAIDIASGLDYLHNRFHVPIVHCDLKPSNVLLENDMTACVCDFGLATYLPDTSCPVPSVQNPSNSIRGTIGYIAPGNTAELIIALYSSCFTRKYLFDFVFDVFNHMLSRKNLEYGMGGAVSKPGDVYSYGILLLEMLTGKRPTDNMFRDDKNLHNFVLMALPQNVKDICDPVLLQEIGSSSNTNPTSTGNDVKSETQRIEECLNSIARLGVACSVHKPKARLEIGEVVSELRVIRDKGSTSSFKRHVMEDFIKQVFASPTKTS